MTMKTEAKLHEAVDSWDARARVEAATTTNIVSNGRNTARAIGAIFGLVVFALIMLWPFFLGRG